MALLAKNLLHLTNIGEETGQVFIQTRKSFWVRYSKQLTGVWQIAIGGTTATVTVEPGETLYFESSCGYAPCGSTISKSWICPISSQFSIGGKLISLLNGGSGEMVEIPIYGFGELFADSPNIVQLEPGLLDASFIAKNAFCATFANCTGLTTIPKGVFTEDLSGENAYQEMFYGCINLKEIHVPWTFMWPGTNGWVSGVAEHGDFYCYEGLALIRDASHIPLKWTIHVKRPRTGGSIIYNRNIPKHGFRMPEEFIYEYEE